MLAGQSMQQQQMLLPQQQQHFETSGTPTVNHTTIAIQSVWQNSRKTDKTI
jgi:hypothetical protein